VSAPRSLIVIGALTALLVGGGGVANAAATTGPGYTVGTDAAGTVVRWNPCAPIHYTVNLGQGGAGAAADVAQAVGILRTDSGLNLVDDGTTTDVPQADYGAGTPPGQNGPLRIAFVDPGASTLLSTAPGVVGDGGTTSYGPYQNHPTQVVGGFAVISSQAALTPGFGPTNGGPASRGRFLLHELGHAVGLGHTDDPDQVMFEYTDGRYTPDYGSGDKAGLARVGAPAGCIGATPPTAGTPTPTPVPVAAPAAVQAAAPVPGFFEILLGYLTQFARFFHLFGL